MSDAVRQELSVALTIPAGPVVLCDAKFLHALAEVERSIASLKVESPEQAQQAATFIQRLTTAAKRLDEDRKRVKDPFLNAGRLIDEAAKAPANRIDAAKRSVNGMLVQWQIAERKKADEAEKARKAAEEAAKKLAQEATPGWGDMDFSEPVAVVAAPVAQQPTGIRWVTKLVLVVEDVSKLPEEFVVRSANEKLLREKYTIGWSEEKGLPTCPGVVFKIDRMAVSKGGGPEVAHMHSQHPDFKAVE